MFPHLSSLMILHAQAKSKARSPSGSFCKHLHALDAALSWSVHLALRFIPLVLVHHTSNKDRKKSAREYFMQMHLMETDSILSALEPHIHPVRRARHSSQAGRLVLIYSAVSQWENAGRPLRHEQIGLEGKFEIQH